MFLIKRLVDIVISALALLLLWPVLLITAVFILLTIGWPIVFVQHRPGKNGQPFKLVKFRTMRVASSDSLDAQSDAERLTKVGAILRRFSIDELPELLNVLKGDMSLVGPRPLLMEYLQHYSPEQARRHEVRPGLTGWAQVNGRNAISWREKFKLDVWYVDNMSFWLDIKIMCMTVRQLVKPAGIGQGDQPTAPKFTGNN